MWEQNALLISQSFKRCLLLFLSWTKFLLKILMAFFHSSPTQSPGREKPVSKTNVSMTFAQWTGLMVLYTGIPPSCLGSCVIFGQMYQTERGLFFFFPNTLWVGSKLMCHEHRSFFIEKEGRVRWGSPQSKERSQMLSGSPSCEEV